MGRYYSDPDGIEDALDDIDERLSALESAAGLRNFSQAELENLDVLLSIFSDGEAREMAQRLREKLPVKAERDQARTEPGVPAWVAILAVAAAEMRRDQSIFPDPMPENPEDAPGGTTAWRQFAEQIETALGMARRDPLEESENVQRTTAS